MGRFRIPMLSCLVALTLAAALGFSFTASADDCLSVATKAIEQKGFTIRDAATLESLAEPQNSSLTAYRAWFRVARCDKGFIVVNMRPSCAIKEIWAQGDCDVPDVRQALTPQN